MYTFEELCGNDSWETTFAYWVLIEKKPLPKQAATLTALHSWMGYHYGAEEQAYDATMLRTNEELIPEYVRLIAPVTLAEKWTPFAQAIEILGQPLRAEKNKRSTSALCAFEPKFLGACMPENRSEHVRHFIFLLRLACSVALKEKGRIIILGSPGWSYQGWKNDFYMMNPDAALHMHEAGYLYTDRIAQ